jgi:hypothetical protein
VGPEERRSVMTWKVQTQDVGNLDELDVAMDDLYERRQRVIAVVPTGQQSFRIYSAPQEQLPGGRA